MDDSNNSGVEMYALKPSRFAWLTRLKSTFSQWPKKVRLIILTLVVLVVGGTTAYFVQKQVTSEKPVLVVGSKKLFKEEYDKLISQAKQRQINPEGAKSQIIDAYKILAAGDKVGIVINEEKLKSPIKAGRKSYDADRFADLMARSAYITKEISLRETPGFQGYAFYFPFSRHIIVDPITESEYKADPVKAAEDEKYAMQKAQSARDRLKSNKISPEKLTEEILKDARLRYGTSANQTGRFIVDEQGLPIDITDTSGTSTTVSKFWDIVPGLKVNEPTDLRDEKQFYFDQNSKTTVNDKVAYYFVVKTKDLQADNNFKEKYQNELKSVKVVDNVK